MDKLSSKIDEIDIVTSELPLSIRFSKEMSYKSKFVGSLSNGSDPTILYFGNTDIILTYSVNKNIWNLYKYDGQPKVSFLYHSSASTLLDGTVLITGGENSN